MSYFLIDKDKIIENSKRIQKLCSRVSNLRPLYSLKANSFSFVIDLISEHVEGFSCSSVFEARLASSLIDKTKDAEITIFNPYIDPVEIFNNVEIFKDAYLTFNNIKQIKEFPKNKRLRSAKGLRVDPEISFVEDERYNPSRKSSKLGQCVDQILKDEQLNDVINSIHYLHVHNNCNSKDLSQIETTFEKIKRLAMSLNIGSINLGGGYIIDKDTKTENFESFLNENKGFDFTIEQGHSYVSKAIDLHAEVVDVFMKHNKQIAVLDTSVNHVPEVFEYQFEPDVSFDAHEGAHPVVLAGLTCLAGDIFGEYNLSRFLKKGEKVIIKDVGAYSLVKAHFFNGVNLPNIACKLSNGKVIKLKEYDYSFFRNLHTMF